MDSFDEMGLSPVLVEALAQEGVERPNALQQKAIPVLSRGNDLVLRAGPGAGVTVAWGAPLLDRLIREAEAGEDDPTPGPRLLVLTPDEVRARGLAESLGRLALPAGVRVAALGPGWMAAHQADVLVATPEALGALPGGTVPLDGVTALVLDGLGSQFLSGQGDAVARIADAVGDSCQKVVAGLPVTEEVHAFAQRRLRRAMHVPPAVREEGDGSPRRGTVEFTFIREDRLAETVDRVAELLEGGAEHVLVFCRTEDGAADVGDLLALHGYMAGMPGEDGAPVWLAVDDMTGRNGLRESRDPEAVATLSMDAPEDPDALDRRHGLGAGGHVLIHPRELPHLRETAREAGYGLRSTLPEARIGGSSPEEGEARPLPGELMERIRRFRTAGPEAAQLLARYGADRVAAAAVELILDRGISRAATAEELDGRARPPDVPLWVKLFLSVGRKDGVGPREILGAITGEAGIPGDQVGRMEVKDTFSRVEVREEVAPQVIRALNGTSIRGRSVRADWDRGAPRTERPRS